jgi:hypothetical protein
VLAVAASTFQNPAAFRRAYESEAAGEEWADASLPYLGGPTAPRTIRVGVDASARGRDSDSEAARRVEQTARQLYLVPGRRRRITKNALRTAAGLPRGLRAAAGSQVDEALTRWVESTAGWTEYRLFEAAWKLSSHAQLVTAAGLARSARLPRHKRHLAVAFLREYPQLAA